MSGRFVGTAVPRVSGLAPTGYQAPANWSSPAVSGRDLMVDRGTLRVVASELTVLARGLQTSLAEAQRAAAATGAAGEWPTAQALNTAMTRAHAGVTRFAVDLRQAHLDTATKLAVSADRYDTAEQYLTQRIHAAADPTATIIASGGQNRPVDPGYGQNWTPQQRLANARMQRLMNMPGNSGPLWTGTFPVTDGAGFPGTSAAGYTWQDVQGLLAATNPEAITQAGAAYQQLSQALTSVASTLPSLAGRLAANWGGTNAVTAVSQVQQLYQTAADLQANTWAAAQALQWYGPVLAAFKASPLRPASAHPADVAAANHAAQQQMEALNAHTQTAFTQMPPVVNKNLPPPPAGSGSAVGAGASAGAAGHAGIAPSAGGGAGGAPAGAGPGTPAPQPAGGSGQHQPAVAQLAQAVPGGTAAPAPPAPAGAGAGLPPPAGGGPGAVGVLPPPASGAAAGEPVPASEFGAVPRTAMAGEPVPASEFGAVPRTAMAADQAVAGETVPADVAVSGQQAAGAANGALSGEGAVAGDRAMAPGFMPGGGAAGAGAQDGFGRPRQSWVSEEEGTWNPGAGTAGDSMVAGNGTGWELPVGPGGSGRENQRERSRLAWLAEDEDFWDPGEPAVPPVIGAPAAAR